MVFENVELRDLVVLQAGVPKTLRFASAVAERQTITEHKTGLSKDIDTWKLTVTEEDGKAVQKELNIASKRLARLLGAYEADGRLFTKAFRITKYGSPPTTTYSVETVA